MRSSKNGNANPPSFLLIISLLSLRQIQRHQTIAHHNHYVNHNQTGHSNLDPLATGAYTRANPQRSYTHGWNTDIND